MRRVMTILALAMSVSLSAMGAHAFPTGAILLTSPANARVISMGEVGVADNADPSTIFFNPANTCGIVRVYGLVAQQRYTEELADDIWLRKANTGFSAQLGVQSPFSVGVDIGYSRLSYGETILTDLESNTLDTLTTYEDVVSLASGFAARAGETFEFRFGAAAKIWRAHFDEEFSATSFDAGFAIDIHERYGAWNITPTFAASVLDLGQDIEVHDSTDPLPTRASFGAAIRVESAPCEILSARVPLLAVVCQAEGIKGVDFDRHEWGIGSEIAIAQILFLRNGVRRYVDRDSSPTYASWGVGAGIPAGPLRLRFDYARQSREFVKDYMDVLVELTF